MRFHLANAFFINFLIFSNGEIVRDKNDEWNDLLNWFREVKTKGNPNLDVVGFSQEDVTLEDEGDPPRVDSEAEWDRLVNGDVTTEKDIFDAGTVYTEEDGEGEKQIRGASLAFVFDSTGSMRDELNQVKAGASKILAALRDHPDAPIYNYIWVPFSDPVIGPITVTTDPKLFQERMQDVMVFGGGDCPEMSIGAIKKALEAGLPNSYIYVFTDASAKDHRLLNEVLSLVQRKQTQVVFILTGDCMDLDEPNYKAYERIAETSSGQIYRLSRNEVKEVLKYVKVALQPHVVSLASLSKPAPEKGNPDKLEVLVDESLKQFTVSVSGVNASINVTDPKGGIIDGPPRLEKVLNLTNIKVVNVKEPDPGSWSVFVGSDSNYTVRSTGLSKVNFNHGFSTVETINLKETNYRPLKGAKSFILIQTSDTGKVYNLTTLDFVSLNGDILQQLPLTPVPEIPGLYKAGGFLPPPEFFYLGVTGFGEDGHPVKRITSTAVSAQLPEKPIITMRTKAVGRVNSPGFLKCYIESVVPFTVRWYKNGVFIGEEKNCSETCEVVLNIEKFTLQSEGTYSCSAKNVAGSDRKSLTLTVSGDAPSVVVNSPVVTSIGETALLNCLVESKIPFVVKWMQFTAKNQHSGVLHPVSTGIKLENNSLMIESVKAQDEGWYVCNAANKGGESKGRVLLVIKEPLRVKVEPSSLTFVTGGSARFTCSAVGKPQPRLEWVKDQQPLKDEDPSIFVEEINGNLNLMIDYLEKKNAGVYVCNAVTAEESASASGELIYTETAAVKAKENNLMVKSGTKVVLQCEATGSPQPTITWFKGEQDISDDPKYEVEGGVLVIQSAHSSDGGEFSCIARNHLGSDIDYIGLIVGSPPIFIQKPRDKKIQLNHNGTISCSALGVPPPEIKWRKSNGRDLDGNRMFVLPSGALRITKMRVEDSGQYVCTAENVFGSVRNEVSIKVTGVEKPTPDKNVDLRNVETLSGTELTLPCGIILGNPPAKVKWLKNGVEVHPGEEIAIDGSGNLVIRNATAADRGSYLCLAQNAAGNSSRPYEVLITESPRIGKTSESDLKGKVGGEIVIPCPVEGFPVPTVTWTKNGLPLPISPTIFQDDSGNLIIQNLGEENSGVYVCTAINAVGSASKTTSIQVQVPPVFPTDVRDSDVYVVEGHVVVLNCNSTAVPEPSIKWFKNDEPLLQNGDQPKILRFVANMDDTGIFKCVVENEAGSSAKDFNVTILVPPKILGRNNEESIKAKAGIPITLLCDVFGVPPPTILWQRNGMYLTQNTSEITISASGTLTIQNVTKESAGAYTCDAENLGGITQRVFYLQVNYPPKIIEEGNASKVITLKEGEEFSVGCRVDGNPKPSVIWKKNGLPLQGGHHDLIILEDNTLVFLQVTKETTGVYKCEAVSGEGSTFTEHEVKVLIPPSLTSDFYPTRLEVNEGDSITLTCPTSFSEPPPNIQWIKDGEPLDIFLQERSDEAQMKLTLDQRILTIIEAHPSDRGNYSCVATNVAGRTDARFLVDVLMTPHFEEFNHVAHRTILTGGDVVLNCSVSGNPPPKVTWRKENTPITPHNTPGVHVSLDKQHLVITNGRVDHTGTYVCLATNKVNAKEREFYVTVLEPPQIAGPLQQEIDIMEGDNVTLLCEGSGTPPPNITWTKQDQTKRVLNNTENVLKIIKAACNDSGVYFCDVTNIAGKRTKYFQLNVLEPPRVENQGQVEEVTGVIGGNVTMKCKTSGHPKPEITWLHNGRILHKVRKRSSDDYSAEEWFTEDGYVFLTLKDLREHNSGKYTLLASNKAGIVQKNFNVQILVPPRLLDGQQEIKILKVVHPFPIILNCPVRGDPSPWILWFYGKINGKRIIGGGNVILEGNKLRIQKPTAQNSGVYVCLAENPAGRIASYFNVTFIEPPQVENQRQEIVSLVNDTLLLHCNSTGGETRSWFHSAVLVKNSSETTISDSGRKLVIPRVGVKHSGVYTCLSTNAAGSAEVKYTVDIHEPPTVSDQSPVENHKIVQLHRPFSLYCFFTGYPPPKITWFKNGIPFDPKHSENSVLSDNSYLTFSASKPDDSGDYKCVARNKVGMREMNFRVDVLIPGEWSPWSEWSDCSVSCGLGEQKRQRSCILENSGLKKSGCEGESSSKRICFKECQVGWGSWTPCSVSCGRGFRRRQRKCESTDCTKESMDEMCFERECPVDGQWSEWSPWSKCSDPCGGGVKQRIRKCDSPFPQHGGDECPGWGSEIKMCNRHPCHEQGRWLPWTDWSSCSATCGKGQRRRYRLCSSRNCQGGNFQTEKCIIRTCQKPTFPSSANLYVRGNLNGNPIDNRFDVNIENLDSERQISTNMNDLLQKKDKWFPYAPFILSPLSWNTAYEIDNAENGHSLTDGNFFSQSEIQFASGEELKVKHKADGVDQNGTLTVEIEVVGEVPLVEPHSYVYMKPLQQDFMQTSRNTLFSSSQNNVSVEGRDVPYVWNSSIRYDDSRGAMPYLVERLSTRQVDHRYNPETKNVSFTASSTIGKKFDEDRCPPGFSHDPQHMHCADINECETPETSCGNGESCENTFGSYKCVCRKGFQPVQNSCVDVDECYSKIDGCSHNCHNTLGTYRCSCPFGFFLAPDMKTCLGSEDFSYSDELDYSNYRRMNTTFSDYDYGRMQEFKAVQGISCPPGFFFYRNACRDYNECDDRPNVCDKDETCINFPGSYKCLSIPCPTGYQRIPSNKNCIKRCSSDKKCHKGASVSESVVFYPVTLNPSSSVVVHLNDIGDPQCNVITTRYRVAEAKEIFEVRVSNGRGSLYAIKRLNRNTLYRVEVEAFSYGINDSLLYYTEFVVFVVLE